MTFGKDTLVALRCKSCAFYKESDKGLECGPFKILEGLLKKKNVTPEEIDDVPPR
jgi:hypothetical protein